MIIKARLMVPTEILAEQHARNIKRLLAKSPYRIELLSGSLKTADKKRLHQAISSGEVHAVVGTHALIQESVAFKNLGLVIIDEQHRFGVMQRAGLRAPRCQSGRAGDDGHADSSFAGDDCLWRFGRFGHR